MYTEHSVRIGIYFDNQLSQSPKFAEIQMDGACSPGEMNLISPLDFNYSTLYSEPFMMKK